MDLSLTRRRQREIKKLRRQADKLWEEQRRVGAKASSLAKEASHQARLYGDERIAPEVRRVTRDARNTGQNALSRATKGWNSSVVPAIATGLGSFAAMAQIAKDSRVQDAIDNVRRFATVPEVAPARPQRSGPSPVQWVLIGVGVVAVAGAAYAAWQTLRADDDLWIPDADEFDAYPPAPPASSAPAVGQAGQGAAGAEA